ncbi:helix-turn-helix domain-containing protein [Caviibacterium pharyngocola]|uniref:XRE family transcriptional regulator n=1 Tax=Caviibacterium pharyngocola TaxID=28159 RepID=A0A2M8RW17_9PAST|nr:helix-turn-helix transcriptional regulator [Caviibacterium pharyngocola]PJG83088.1 XRE family transcriptional regulator [Caviibacterium pharyngocola]
MILEDLGLRIKQLRAREGLSQESLALKIGMDRSYLASIEVGGRNVSLLNLKKLADGLNVSLSELFEDL